MKRKGFWVGIIIGIIAGVLASIPISYWLLNYEAYILPQLNLVEVANLVMTLLLAVGIPLYIQNQIDNKK